MAHYTQLDDDDLRAIAGRFDLGQVQACHPLWAGTINSNFRLETDRGRLFLRVNEGKVLDEVVYEAELVSHLAAHGVPTPRPLPARDGLPYADLDGRLLTLFSWAGGRHPDPPGADDAAAAGGALARIHLAGAGFPRRRESRYDLPRIVARAAGIVDPPPEVRPVLEDVRGELAALAARPALPAGIIHGDLFPDNVLTGGPEGIVLLDFEQASDGVFAYDLAVCILSWCWDGRDLDAGLAGAMRAGYEAVRPLTPAEDEGLLVEARLAAARFTVTRLTDVALNPRASAELRASKDYQAFYSRLERVRALRRLA